MKAWETEDAVLTIGRLVNLIDARTNGIGRAAADWRRSSGDLVASAEHLLAGDGIGIAFATIFPIATAAGVDAARWRILGASFADDNAMSRAGQAVAVAALRLALVERCRIATVTRFASRDAARRMLDRLSADFDSAIIVASDRGDVDAQAALMALNAAVVHDITERGRPLARIVSYATDAPLPSLVLAQRLYADPTRADELRAMNEVANPLFMPISGIALSA